MVRTTALLVCLVTALWGARLEEKQAIQKTFPAAAELEVDNVNGRVHVKGSDVREVRVTAYETIRADTQDEIARARGEVKLEMTETGNRLRIYVDGPFRGHDSGRRDYEVRYDFEIEAPRSSVIRLRTVNGPINVEDIAAGFDVSTVNGRVDMQNMASSGRAHTVNGGVKATFRENPRESSSFNTVNGAVELYFQPGLAADVSVKTMHGEVSSDFPFSALPAAAEVSHEGGRNVYRANRSTNIRIGAGGPAIKCETLNGGIRILLWEGVR